MKLSNDLRRGRNCVFLMHVHLVFIAKYRRNIFTKSILNDLSDIFSSICTEFEGEGDHVHLLIEYPPKVAARLIRKKGYPSIQKALWGGSLWSPSYFAGACGGAPLAVIRQYIEQQSSPTEEKKPCK